MTTIKTVKPKKIIGKVCLTLLKKEPIAYFLLPFYFILTVWNINYAETPLYSIFRVLLLTVFFSALLYFLLRTLLHESTKSGLIGTALVLPFFLYGHIYNIIQIDKKLIFGIHTILFPLVLCLSAVGLFLGNKVYQKHKISLNLFANLFSILLIFMVIIQTIVDISILKKTDNNNPAFSNEGINVVPSRTTEIGDVYYIVVDGYPRQDVLQEEFLIDNSAFLSKLKELGFVIPECTLSNYDNTIFSLASSFNMEYLDNLGVIPNEPSKNFKPITFYNPIHDSVVRQEFQDLGYKFVTFKSLYPFLDISNSDVYFDMDEAKPFFNKIESLRFQHLVLSTTLLKPFLGEHIKSHETRLYNQYVFTLESIKKIPDIPDRKFIYAHLYIIHNPFVFSKDGKIRTSFEESDEAFAEAVEFADQQLLTIVKEIIKKSKTPPIIIIQGDHSYKLIGANRLKILNAYYLPSGGTEQLYKTITPVNTFRLILKYYFGKNYPLIPDRSFYRENGVQQTLLESTGSCEE